MSEFNGRVVIVTGGCGNLGAVAVHVFADAGATVAIVDREDKPGELLKDIDLEKHLFIGGVDALDADSVSDMVKTVHEHFARIDVLVNTVGGYKAGDPVHKTDIDTWAFMLDLNAKSAFIISQAVIPIMLEQKQGAIVHTGATAGLQGSANHAAYSASKAALFRLVESLSAEYKGDNLTINAVLPKTLDTPQNREAMPNANFERWVKPEQIAAVMHFLASDAGHVITGALVPVTGKG